MSVWGACSESGKVPPRMSHQGGYLEGTAEGLGGGPGCPRRWGDSSLVTPFPGWLEEMERKHRDTCSKIPSTIVTPHSLGSTPKAKQACGAAGGRQEPYRQWDGAKKGSLGAGSVGERNLGSEEVTGFGRPKRTGMGPPDIGSTSHQEGKVSRSFCERVP